MSEGEGGGCGNTLDKYCNFVSSYQDGSVHSAGSSEDLYQILRTNFAILTDKLYIQCFAVSLIWNSSLSYMIVEVLEKTFIDILMIPIYL